MAAIYLVEYGRGTIARLVTFFVDVMTGVPSIVAGLFAYALFVIFFGPGVRMGLGGAIALSLLMIPVVIRATEEMLKIVPNELREAAYALGVPKWLYELMGGGGTDFMANWTYMKEQEYVPKKLIMFTDGYAWDSWGDPDYCDTVFVIHSNRDKNLEGPFGTSVHYDAAA